MPLGSLLWKGGIRSYERLWLRMIQTIKWAVSHNSGAAVVSAPAGVRP